MGLCFFVSACFSVGYFTFIRNDLNDENMEIVKSELEALFNETNNVFTGIILLRKEIRGSDKEETIIAGRANVQG